MVKLETKTPIDLLHYEPPGILGATTRQLLCLAGTAVTGAAVYCLLRFIVKLPDQFLGYTFIFTTIPFIALGWLKPYGLPLEVFLGIYFRYLFSAVQCSAVNERNDYLHVPFSEKEGPEYPASYRPIRKRELRRHRRVLRAEVKRCCKEVRRANRLQKRKDRQEKRKKA